MSYSLTGNIDVKLFYLSQCKGGCCYENNPVNGGTKYGTTLSLADMLEVGYLNQEVHANNHTLW